MVGASPSSLKPDLRDEVPSERKGGFGIHIEKLAVMSHNAEGKDGTDQSIEQLKKLIKIAIVFQSE